MWGRTGACGRGDAHPSPGRPGRRGTRAGRKVSFVLRTPPAPYYDGAVQAHRNALNKGRRAGPVRTETAARDAGTPASYLK